MGRRYSILPNMGLCLCLCSRHHMASAIIYTSYPLMVQSQLSLAEGRFTPRTGCQRIAGGYLWYMSNGFIRAKYLRWCCSIARKKAVICVTDMWDARRHFSTTYLNSRWWEQLPWCAERYLSFKIHNKHQYISFHTVFWLMRAVSDVLMSLTLAHM